MTPCIRGCEASVQNKAPPVRFCLRTGGAFQVSRKKSKEVKEESGEKAGGGKAMHLCDSNVQAHAANAAQI
jgi:hypothetical protein